MVSVPVSKNRIGDLRDPVSFSSSAQLHDLLTQRVAFPLRQHFRPDEVVKGAYEQTATFQLVTRARTKRCIGDEGLTSRHQ